MGLQADLADRAAPALEMIRGAAAKGNAYGLVVLDCHMPEMDGPELATAIRGEPCSMGVPLILLTSSVRPLDDGMARGARVQAVVTKPLKMAALHDALVAVTAVGTAPVVAAASAAPSMLRESAERPPARILVAEDNIVNQKVASRFIEKLGYLVDVAANGRQAVAAVATGLYDIVLMDCHMPEMDGYDATRAIRALGTEGTIPVIAMTAGAMAWEREKCIAAGMDDFLTKPVRVDVLGETIERWLPKI